MDFSPESLRKHWNELTKKREAIDAKLVPARAELDELAAGDHKLGAKAAMKREAELRGEIVTLQRKLAPIETQRAAVARALGGKTSEPG